MLLPALPMTPMMSVMLRNPMMTPQLQGQSTGGVELKLALAFLSLLSVRPKGKTWRGHKESRQVAPVSQCARDAQDMRRIRGAYSRARSGSYYTVGRDTRQIFR